jgi:hypothetical protein
MRSLHTKTRSAPRDGTTIVEMAVVIPVFAIFVAALFEFGHVFLVVQTLNAAAKQGARYGAVQGISSADVMARVNEIVGSAFDPAEVTVIIKDASVYDDGVTDPATIDVDELPDIELTNALWRQLYVVKCELHYDEIAITKPFWAESLVLTGQSVMRHE